MVTQQGKMITFVSGCITQNKTNLACKSLQDLRTINQSDTVIKLTQVMQHLLIKHRIVSANMYSFHLSPRG